MARARYHHGDLRTALVVAAREFIEREGAAGFSLREAARRVGVDPAACYRHFRNREEVLLAIAQEGFAALAASFTEVRVKSRRADRPRELLVGLGRAYLAFAFARRAEFRIMFGESGTEARDPRLRLPTVERTAYEQLEDVVLAYLADVGMRRGDPARTAVQLWATVHGVTRLALDGAIPLDEPGARGVLDDAIAVALDGLESRARKGRR